jgi:hypothetical protein
VPIPGSLPAIPLIDARREGTLAIVAGAPDRFAELLACGRRSYGGTFLRFGDAAGRRWLARNGNPYGAEIAAAAARAGTPGLTMLNLSYEWSCTSGVGAAPDGGGVRLLRTLDWPLDGLGRTLVVARRTGAAGDYLDVTWPGFSGVATALAPGRFAAAINQPPMSRLTPSSHLDWLLSRPAVWRSRDLPPVHLIRRVFETCGDYAAAKAMLAETPLCMPAFFILAGTAPGEGCVIERRRTAARLHEMPAAIANHWLDPADSGRARGIDSLGRLAAMEQRRDAAGDGFAWVTPPILNATTRAAVVADPARGLLLVRGYEVDGPATADFHLREQEVCLSDC